ncbi:hypothetical protein OAF98_00600 [Planctomicrobium sp.]|jgi:hypothetical protein|nr:hypothetical protein [Planctomicrobium sp.]MBT5020324.1 hypothetical protein [Planctomicrobium sp.]MDB4742957.1 hypothetical protein [Planctomicrobium sp.]
MEPEVVEIELRKSYQFMYENFVIVTQTGVYLLLEKRHVNVDVLYFDSPQVKYGSPNDEARGGHPLWKRGLGFYGFFEVLHSPWVREQMIANRVHDRHFDDMYKNDRHFIVCFKDVMLEVTCRKYEEREMTVSEIELLIQEQLLNLTE